MNKLKTLKDLSNESRYDIGKKTKLNAVLIDDLKQEASKWIKSMDGNCEGLDYDRFGIDNGQLQEWIEYFFNITEEDLK